MLLNGLGVVFGFGIEPVGAIRRGIGKLSTTRRIDPRMRAALGVRTRLRSSCIEMPKQRSKRLSTTQ